ncbi:MAG TPA: YihY/virulence factor BrkB family protein, partial [Nocardioides sp.]|nr:YihY/virulence factor BrkB family protein [Nocardioides sp.]
MNDTTDRDRSEAVTPAPDSAAKSDSPTDLSKRSWGYVARKSLREFTSDQCTDLAAALTYYSVLAFFPAAIALLSLLGVVGRAEESVDTALDVLRPIVSTDLVRTIEPTLRDFASSDAAGFALVLGFATALWSASGYVGAFSRAMNRVYEIPEGRPFWKLRPVMILVTLLAVVLIAVVLLLVVVSGPLADSLGNQIGLSEPTVLAWKIVKWPIIALAVMTIVAMLYYATPNVKQPKFRWISVGALVAIVVWLLASGLFALYLATFADYSKTYGSLAGVIVFLLFLWITNL